MDVTRWELKIFHEPWLIIGIARLGHCLQEEVTILEPNDQLKMTMPGGIEVPARTKELVVVGWRKWCRDRNWEVCASWRFGFLGYIGFDGVKLYVVQIKYTPYMLVVWSKIVGLCLSYYKWRRNPSLCGHTSNVLHLFFAVKWDVQVKIKNIFGLYIPKLLRPKFAPLLFSLSICLLS